MLKKLNAVYSADFMGRGRGRNLKLLRPISKASRVNPNYEEMSTKKLRVLKGLRTFSPVYETTTRIICVKCRRARNYTFFGAINKIALTVLFYWRGERVRSRFNHLLSVFLHLIVP